jgi:DNA-binding XRE family transcriptional regulator
MILNQRQYNVTKGQIQRLQTAIEISNETKTTMDSKVYRSMIRGLQSQIDELRHQINEYAKVRNAKSLVLSSIEELPSILIKSRIARGYTQKELAESINVDARQIQRYEKTNYSTISLERAVSILKALEIDF